MNKFIVHFIALNNLRYKGRKSGDSIFIEFPDDTNMLVDCGIYEAGQLITDYLRTNGVFSIDRIVISHFHKDHIGGLPDILDNFHVKKIYSHPLDYFQLDPFPDELLHLISLVKQGRISWIPLQEDMELVFGGVRCKVLGPFKSFPRNKEEYNTYFMHSPLIHHFDNIIPPDAMFLNDSSITLRFDYGKSSFLTSGDLYFLGEFELLSRHKDELHASLWKINHHMTYTSNTEEFIKEVSPKIAIAFRDTDLPLPENKLFWGKYATSVLNTLDRYKIKYYLTRDSGSVSVMLEKDGRINTLSP